MNIDNNVKDWPGVEKKRLAEHRVPPWILSLIVLGVGIILAADFI